jgi:hypothetical protein
LFASSIPNEEAFKVAQQYFAQGHDINFLSVKDWLINLLGTIGAKCREIFSDEFLNLLDSSKVPAILKLHGMTKSGIY